MTSKLTILSLLLTMITFAQSSFKEGHYIKKNNSKEVGLFRSFGANLPEELEFKEKENSIDTKTVITEELSELKIDDAWYKRKNVLIEYLGENMLASTENNVKTFNLESYPLFLSLLLEFKNLTLYSYTKDSNDYFFIERNGEIKLLEYKTIVLNGRQVKIRNFVDQLIKSLSPLNPELYMKIGSLKYEEDSLVQFLIDYANQENHDYSVYNPGVSRNLKDAFNITPKIGYSFVSQNTETGSNDFKTTLNENQINFGLDIEYFFNTLQKKSSLIFSYSYYTEINSESDYTFTTPDDSQILNKFNMNTLNLKYRYYLNLGINQNLYIDGGLLVHSSKGKVEYVFIPTDAFIVDLEYENANNNISFSIGLGYNYKSFYLQLNYIPQMSGTFNILSSNAVNDNWQFDRNVLNMSFGYSIF